MQLFILNFTNYLKFNLLNFLTVIRLLQNSNLLNQLMQLHLLIQTLNKIQTPNIIMTILSTTNTMVFFFSKISLIMKDIQVTVLTTTLNTNSNNLLEPTPPLPPQAKLLHPPLQHHMKIQMLKLTPIPTPTMATINTTPLLSVFLP